MTKQLVGKYFSETMFKFDIFCIVQRLKHLQKLLTYLVIAFLQVFSFTKHQHIFTEYTTFRKKLRRL